MLLSLAENLKFLINESHTVQKIGGPEVLNDVKIKDPAPEPGKLLVRAAAFGVGKPDVLLRTGGYKRVPPLLQ